jgi:hypothetical protein
VRTASSFAAILPARQLQVVDYSFRRYCRMDRSAQGVGVVRRSKTAATGSFGSTIA